MHPCTCGIHLRNSGVLVVIAEHPKLHKDDSVLGHGAQGSDQPREIRKEVFFLDGVE
jgi:hypothetical protein